MRVLPMRRLSLLILLAAVPTARADDKPADGFLPMFNGKDLTGWVNVNCAPSTFFVKDNEIITTGVPTGYLRTEKLYENFVAEFDWMHVPPQPGAVGNSGFFVWADPLPAVGTGYTRGIEVQVLVNLTYKNKKGEITATSQGDLFSIWGATCVPERPHPDGWARCLPSENHAKGEREWNHYRVEANDGRITLAVNGHVVSGVSKCNPRKGYLALESEGSECHFKNLKIKELPSTNPKPEEIAEVDEGFVSLFNGLDLTGWKVDDAVKAHWSAPGWGLRFDGKDEKFSHLWTEREFSDFELRVDVRIPANQKGEAAPMTSWGMGHRPWPGAYYPKAQNPQDIKPAGQWNRYLIRWEDGVITKTTVNGKPCFEPLQKFRLVEKSPIALAVSGGAVEFGNIFIRELKK
jgi:hypothetical protein